MHCSIWTLHPTRRCASCSGKARSDELAGRPRACRQAGAAMNLLLLFPAGLAALAALLLPLLIHLARRSEHRPT
ncbi:hypothetical protein, partial [Xanthomonas citri]|uniref:hypothetical protein n=1 Tax=Xanthomonas citri TaxID=346 RepID=UPI003CCFEF4E